MLRVGLILPAGFHLMSYATIATFDTANFVAGEQFYDISMQKLVSRLPAPSRIFVLRPPDICSSREGCRSRKSTRKPALATVSGCAEASCAPLDERLRPYATPPIHSPRYRRALEAGFLVRSSHRGHGGN
jgi:hypothetical protein